MFPFLKRLALIDLSPKSIGKWLPVAFGKYFSIFTLDSHTPYLASPPILVLTWQLIYSILNWTSNDDKARSLTSILPQNCQLQKVLKCALRCVLYKSSFDIESLSSIQFHKWTLYTPTPMSKITWSAITWTVVNIFKNKNVLQENIFLHLCGNLWLKTQNANGHKSLLKINFTSEKWALNGPAVIYSKIQNRSCGTSKTTPMVCSLIY